MPIKLKLFGNYLLLFDECLFLEDYNCIETHYDEHKNLTKLVTYDNIRKVSHTTTIDYKYDTVGNIIERLITYDSGNKELRKSEFEYY